MEHWVSQVVVVVVVHIRARLLQLRPVHLLMLLLDLVAVQVLQMEEMGEMVEVHHLAQTLQIQLLMEDQELRPQVAVLLELQMSMQISPMQEGLVEMDIKPA